MSSLVRILETKEKGDVHKFIKFYFPGETFRILKGKEEKQFSEYRTRHLVLKAWDNL